MFSQPASPARRRDEKELLLRGRRALHKGVAALHLVMQRRLVDLDHDRVGIDAEILDQRLGDVAHHAGLLLVGAARGHADGDLRHINSPFVLARLTQSSLPGLTRQSIILKMDTRVKPAYDEFQSLHFTSCRARIFRTASTSWPWSTSSCASAWRLRYSSRSLISARPAPRTRSLICTLPLSFSSEPCTIAQGALRRSAYFICWPRLCLGLPR